MIHHFVIFSLRYDRHSAEEKAFFDAANRLAAIEGVKNFKRLLQVSKKNNYSFGLAMDFETEAAYDFYNHHPIHQAFIEKYWIPAVTDFLEIDYQPFSATD